MKIFLAFFATLWCSVTSQLLPGLEEALDIKLPKLSQYPNATKFDDPRIHMDTIQLGKYYNYAAEAHDVVTDDGYILEMHRYTGNQTNPNPKGKQPVLLVHGLFLSSVDWAVAGPGRGLAFVLADLGYDVWMANVRGTKYSRRHINAHIAKSVYWDFTFHEMGIYDLPAMIDYVLKENGHEKIFYVGHSQGTTIFFVMLSERPEYNDKIVTSFVLAPAAYISHLTSPTFRVLLTLDPAINVMMQISGRYDIKPISETSIEVMSFFCNDKQVTQSICADLLYLACGYSDEQLDKKMLPVFMAHVPAGCGWKQLRHYAQLVTSGYFRQFDYGPLVNLKKYKSLLPPSYNLNNVRTAISIHHAINDLLATPVDVGITLSKLPNVIGKFLVPRVQFNHIDFVWGLDVKALVYDKIISIMKSQEEPDVEK